MVSVRHEQYGKGAGGAGAAVAHAAGARVAAPARAMVAVRMRLMPAGRPGGCESGQGPGRQGRPVRPNRGVVPQAALRNTPVAAGLAHGVPR